MWRCQNDHPTPYLGNSPHHSRRKWIWDAMPLQQIVRTVGGTVTISSPMSLSFVLTFMQALAAEVAAFTTNVLLVRTGPPLRNNTSERSLGGPVIGGKNWLFAGSEGGAHAAAVHFSIATRPKPSNCVRSGHFYKTTSKGLIWHSWRAQRCRMD